MKNTLLVSLVVVLVVYFVVCVALYRSQEHMIFFPERLSPEHRFSFPNAFREITWQVDGATLHALHFTVDQPKGAILYLHGNAGSLRSWGHVASDFTERGYDVLIPDYRGYGKSTGTLTHERMLLEDALVAYTYLREHYADRDIIMYGRSLGTGIATYVASIHAPSMLVLETPYVSMKELALRQFPFVPSMLLKYPLHTDRWISDVACPVYLLHGTRDEVIPYDSSERLLPLIRSEHQLFTIPGGGHNNLVTFPEYRAALDHILH
jgi:pimeloyl-ACP methyl ester carboxylesterase